jgi:hypothetical protein
MMLIRRKLGTAVLTNDGLTGSDAFDGNPESMLTGRTADIGGNMLPIYGDSLRIVHGTASSLKDYSVCFERSNYSPSGRPCQLIARGGAA